MITCTRRKNETIPSCLNELSWIIAQTGRHAVYVGKRTNEEM